MTPRPGFLRHRYPADITGVVLLRMFGCSVRGNNVHFDRRVLGIWLIGGAGILAWHASFAVGRRDPLGFFVNSTIWAIFFLVACALIAYTAHRLTQGFLDLSSALDRAMSSRGRNVYVEWYRQTSKRRWQILSGAVVGAAAIPALAVVRIEIGDTGRLVVVPSSYLVIFITGFVAGTAAYWAAAGVLLSWRLGRRGSLHLYEPEPAYTVGLEELVQLLISTFLVGALLTGILLFPILYATAGLGSGVLPQPLQVTRDLLIGACAVILIAVAIVPNIRFSRTIRDARHATMSRLQRMLDLSSPPSSSAIEDRYSRVAQSPTSTLGSGNVVQIAVGSAAAVIPLIASVLLR